MAYVIQLEPGVWVAPWDGDPGRTLVKENAYRFRSRAAANRAIKSYQDSGYKVPAAVCVIPADVRKIPAEAGTP